MSQAIVREHYEGYPYPPRDPADEAKRLITGSPSHLDEVNHYVFGGRRDFSRPFRALVAGGGTGDATVMLAQQLADRGGPAEVVYIDLSEASRRIAEARVQARGLDTVRFVRMSLLDLPDSGLGVFDYIDCCGVLHHLDDPAAGLQALVSVLADDGGLGLMLYGELGRAGVYPVQEMLRMIAPGGRDPAPVRLDLTRRLLRSLPASNLLRRNPFVTDYRDDDDAHLFDLFLHATDRAYRVPDIARLLADAGLRLVAFIPPLTYDPSAVVTDPKLAARLAGLDALERAAFAELLAGSLRKHSFYAVRAGNPVTPPDPADPAAVPVPIDLDSAVLGQQFRPGAVLNVTVEGLPLRRPLPDLSGGILKRIDGRRTLAEIHGDMVAAGAPIDWPAFVRQFAGLFAAFNGLAKLMLRVPGP